VKTAQKGQSIGLKVDERIRENDTVYKVLLWSTERLTTLKCIFVERLYEKIY
jgi:hypothetical protein